MRQVSAREVARMAAMDNPWLQKPSEITRLNAQWKPRAYLELLYPLISDTKVHRSIVLMGPRRVGKTVLLHHVIQKLMADGKSPKHICYFSIDHPLYNGLDLEALLRVFAEVSGVDLEKDELFVFYDEIQYLKDWERYLKSITDRYRNIRCVVSGSAAAALRLKSLESGAGRFTDFLLPPLTFYEYLQLIGEDTLVKLERRKYETVPSTDNLPLLNDRFVDYLNFGGYPEMLYSSEAQQNPGRFIKSDIIDKVLLRDLPSLYGIQDIQELNSLFLNLAFNTASEVSLDTLSQRSGLAKNTIKRYIEYLEAAFLVKTVQRVDYNARRFKRANFFKVYLTNPAMWSALFSPVSADDEPTRPLVETAIFSQWFHSETELHYGRWPDGEVDIVCLGSSSQKPVWAVEVKWSDRPLTHPDELANLLFFCGKNDTIGSCLVTTRTQSADRPIRNVDVKFIPASLYCYELGHNIIAGKKIHSEHRRRA